MHTNFFFNSSWIGQLLVGFGLFLCSLFIEYQVLIHFVSPASLAILLCVALEGGKVAAVIWHYYLGCLGGEAYPFSIRLSSAVFRFGLIILSILCSMLFLTARLDRPNLKQVQQQRLQELAHRESATTEIMRRNHKQITSTLARQQEQAIKETEKRTGIRIDGLNALLLKEMNNVVNGVFKGPRYQELKLRLAREKENARQELNVLRNRHEREHKRLQQTQSSSLDRIRSDFDTKRQQLLTSDFADDEQANDGRIVALLKTVQTMFHVQIRPLQFVFCFSILISILMETGIMLSFATITSAIAPVLQERHIEELELEAVRLRSESAQAREETRHRASMDRVQRAAENIFQEAETFADPSLQPEGQTA